MKEERKKGREAALKTDVIKSYCTNPTEGRVLQSQSGHQSPKRSRTTIGQDSIALLSNPDLQEFAETYLPYFSSSESMGDKSK
jgi:hypothetical protein